MRAQLGYADYLGALQRYRVENPHDPHLLKASSYLVDYPFANRLYPGSLDVIERLAGWGPVVILSDGDVVFQPRKIERSGLGEAVEGPGVGGGAPIVTSVWDKVRTDLDDADIGFVPDAWVKTGTTAPQAGDC